MTNKTMKIITSILLVFQSLFSFSQIGPNDIPCTAKSLNDFTQISDSIEFRLNCWTQIDFKDEMCKCSLAEDYIYTVPRETSKLLCVIYFKDQIKSDEIELINLFDNPKYRKKYLNRIQFIFVYDPLSGFNEAFQGKEVIENLLSYDIRKGFKKNE